MSSDVSSADLQDFEQEDQALKDKLAQEFVNMDEDEEQQLSKVLFPDTDVTPLVLLDIERELRPLPLKYSKKLFSMLAPFAKKVAGALQAKIDVEINDDITKSLTDTAVLLATYYKWDDVLLAAQEEELSISDLQRLAIEQQRVNGSNDFLLGPLRSVIMIQQVSEIAQTKFLTMLGTRTSRRNGTAP